MEDRMGNAGHWALPVLRRAAVNVSGKLSKRERADMLALMDANERVLLGCPEAGDVERCNANRAKHGMPPL